MLGKELVVGWWGGPCFQPRHRSGWTGDGRGRVGKVKNIGGLGGGGWHEMEPKWVIRGGKSGGRRLAA